MLDRTLPPPHHPVTRFDLIRPRQFRFPNGIDVFVFQAGEQELVRIEWIVGNVFEREDQGLSHTAVCEMLLEGTSAHSSAELAEIIDFHGAFLIPEFSFDRSALTLFSLNKHLDTLLPLVKEILAESVFPEKELATYIRNSKQKLQVSLKKNAFVARRLFNRTVYGATRYGYVPDPADYDRITGDGLLDLFHKQFVPGNCTLVVAGKVTEDVLVRLEELFGREWVAPTESQPKSSVPVFTDVDGQLVVEERSDALQSAIRLGYRTIGRAHPDFPGLQVLNTVLGGYFGSRLMMNIREDKGYTYSVGSAIASLQHDAFLSIASEVGVEVTRATLEEIRKEIDKLRREPVPAAELDVVRNYLMGAMLGSLENAFSHADKFKQAYFSGLDLTYYDYYTRVVRTITPEELLRLANTYLDYDRMAKVVVGRIN